MRPRGLLAFSMLCVSAFPVLAVQAQQNPPDAPSAESSQTQENGQVIEGVVVSMTPNTLVVRSDDNQYHLFTYNSSTGPKEPVQPNSRVRINGSAPDAVGTRVAEKVTVIHVIDGTVVSTTPNTLVIRSDDNQYRLFTYSSNAIPKETVQPDVRVRVNALAPGAQGTWMADSVTVIRPGEANVSGTEAPSAPPQAPSATAQAPSAGTQASSVSGAQAGQVNQTSLKIEEQARRFHIGGRIGFGLDPELFMFGPQAQFGPFFSSRLMFQPNLEFGFGELTDMYAVNGDAAFRFNKTHGGWIPYFGMGPSFNFVNVSASHADVSFSNFTFQTGLNVFGGIQKNKMFVELKTNLWASNTPVLRLYVGYNF